MTVDRAREFHARRDPAIRRAVGQRTDPCMMAPPMDRLASTPEYLDGPLDDVRELAQNLRDMGRANRLLGGTDLSRGAIAALLDRDVRTIRLLDVGTGGADIPLALLAEWRRRGLDGHVTAVDSRSEVLAAAIAARPELQHASGLELVRADGLGLPFEDRAFHLAHASLVLHHLEPDGALRLLGEMARVSSIGIVINDLARGRAAWLGAWLLAHAFTANRLTRHDGPLSVRRAYTLAEARRLVSDAGLRPEHEASAIAGHRWVIAARCR